MPVQFHYTTLNSLPDTSVVLVVLIVFWFALSIPCRILPLSDTVVEVIGVFSQFLAGYFLGYEFREYQIVHDSSQFLAGYFQHFQPRIHQVRQGALNSLPDTSATHSTSNNIVYLSIPCRILRASPCSMRRQRIHSQFLAGYFIQRTIQIPYSLDISQFLAGYFSTVTLFLLTTEPPPSQFLAGYFLLNRLEELEKKISQFLAGYFALLQSWKHVVVVLSQFLAGYFLLLL